MKPEETPSLSRRPPTSRGRRARLVAGWLIALGCLVYVLRQAVNQADQIRASEYQPGWLTLLAIPCVMLGQLAVGNVTFLLLRLFGARPGWKAVVRIHLMAQVAKYLPAGGLLNVAAQASGLAKLPEVGKARAVGVLPLSLGTILASAATWFGLTALLGTRYPWWLAAGAVAVLPAVLALLHAQRFWQPLASRVLARYVARDGLADAIAPWSAGLLLPALVGLGAWVLFGSSLVLVTGQLTGLQASTAVQIAGVMAAGWVLGFVTLIVPAGLGVREASIMLLLEPLVPPPGPVLVPLVSRLVWMTADVLNLIVAVMLLRRPLRSYTRGSCSTGFGLPVASQRSRRNAGKQTMAAWKETREAVRAAVAEYGARLGKDVIDEMAVPSYLWRGVISRTVFWRKLHHVLRAADLKPNTRVFDFGCGAGVLLVPLSAEGRHVQATDLHLELARAVVERLKLSRVELVASEQWRERVPVGQVETIIAANVLEHVEDRRGLLTTLAGKLSRTGRIVICGPTENRLYRLGRALLRFSGHYHVTTMQAVIRDAEAIGLRRIHLKRWPLPGPACLYQIAAYVR